ncbi:hypothetical protein [Azorhizobium doebereinerae]|uniref:hypothetical protein n=1 Tax=Azorhizobium doebereinerae TaxID=281091 RepID=UPI0004111896|nr:hypothetical protein [Azorhizobium doebereinerae]
MATTFLILTSAQANALRGPTAPGAALEPVALADGARWVLPMSVLDDPAHGSRHAELVALPVDEVTSDLFPTAEVPVISE